jgi:fatty acid desaturase
MNDNLAAVDERHAPAGPVADVMRFVSADELRRFAEIETGPVVRKACVTWGLVLAALSAWSLSRGPVVLVIAFVTVSACQHALFLLAHEGAHFTLARRKWWNDLVSDALFATPIFLTTARYREGHLPHHTRLGDHDGDLEWRLWVLLRGRHGWRLLAATLSGWTAIGAIVRLTPEKLGARESPLRFAAGVGLSNGLLFCACHALGAPLAYFYLWLLPFLTLTQLLLIVRAVAEHQPWSYARRGDPDASVDLTPALTRTFTPNRLERFLMAPVGAQHHEHHLFPGIPFAQLPRLQATLTERGYYAAHRELVHGSYLSLLWRLARPLPSAGAATQDGRPA